jgi:restriction system protein
MAGALLLFLSGLVLGVAGGVLACHCWQARQPKGPEVKDAPLPPAGGTSDPFAQHWSQKLLDLLDWRVFRDVVAAYIRQLGFEAKASAPDESGVIELEGFDPATGRPAMLVRCRVWDRALVDDRAVLGLQAAMAAAGVTQGAYLTTGRFTPAAVAAVAVHNIDLVSGSELLERVGQLPLAAQNHLLDLATEEDYAVPTCPACNVKMVRRMTVAAGQPGVYFWGCRHYPRCQRTFATA